MTFGFFWSELIQIIPNLSSASTKKIPTRFFSFFRNHHKLQVCVFSAFWFLSRALFSFFLSFMMRNWLIFRKIENSNANIASNWPPRGFTPNGDQDALIVFELFLWDTLFSYILATRYLINLKLKQTKNIQEKKWINLYLILWKIKILISMLKPPKLYN